MKLSELSYREYLAIEFLPALMRHYSALGDNETEIAERTAHYAFLYADAFLRVVGKYHDEVAEAHQRAFRAETAADVLRSMDSDVPRRVALEELWQMLGVTNQTMAISKLRGLISFARMQP